MAKKAVIFGAGKIGRGFLAQLAVDSGYEVVFVEVDSGLVALLNEREAYSIRLVGERTKNVLVNGFRALKSCDTEAVAEAVANADVVFTAVGANALESIAPVIADGVERRAGLAGEQPLNIILCENLLDAPERLRSYVAANLGRECADYFAKNVGFVPAIVSRMVPDFSPDLVDTDPLAVIAEEYDKLPIDGRAVVGEVPAIAGLVPVDDFGAYIERKLFIHNAGHSLASYIGYECGYVYIHEAMGDENIRRTVLGALDESSEGLIRKHGFEPGALKEHIADLARRFCNKALGDTTVRGARSPLRKLSRNDRLVGAAAMVLEQGVRPTELVVGIAAALGYDNEEDPEAVRLQEMLRSEGIDAVLENVCGLSPDDTLHATIKDQALKKGLLHT